MKPTGWQGKEREPEMTRMVQEGENDANSVTYAYFYVTNGWKICLSVYKMEIFQI